MKFTDGYWLTREGFTPHHAVQVQDAFERNGSLVVLAAVQRTVERGDVLNAPLLTFEVSSPVQDVFRVRISHFSDGLKHLPTFGLSLPATPPEGRVLVQDDEASLTSGNLSARFRRDGRPWRMSFETKERVLTSSESKGPGHVKNAEGEVWMKEELSLEVGEMIYGLGERFGAFVKNGQSVDIWNKDGGTSSEQAYKNVPFFLSSNGYGVLVQNPGLVSFEIGSEKVSRVQFSVRGEEIEYYLFYGPTPKDILAKYTALTGRPPLPPAWSFGLWLTTSFTTSYDEKTVTGFIQGMEDRKLPLSVFHFDCFWMKEFRWTNFRWDPRTFPDPEGMLRRLKARGLRVCVWINPYIAQQSEVFPEAVDRGYLVKRKDGGVWQTDLWQAGMGIVDFTNPKARDWFASHLESLLDQGVDAFKTDFGERIPIDVVWHDGSDPERMHNYYTYLYNETVFELLRQKRGPGEAVLFARSATVGGQKFPVHWGGDCDSTFASMAESLRGGLSLGLSGFGFWSHDIGGFEGVPPEAVYKRWVAFGMLSSHSRLHGSNAYKVPWIYGDEAVNVLRFFTRLKLRLMPYLFQAAQETVTTGLPVLRAMLLEFPDDPMCGWLDRQYMLGQDLLVAPVFNEQGNVRYYIPEGRWTDFFSGKEFVGPIWKTEIHGFESLPLLVRPGSLVAVGDHDDSPEYDWTKGTTFHLFALEDGRSTTTKITTPKGEPGGSLRVERNGSRYEIRVEGSLTEVKVFFAGATTFNSETGCKAKPVPKGIELALSTSEAAVNILS